QQPPESGCSAGTGCERIRHPASRHAGTHQGRCKRPDRKTERLIIMAAKKKEENKQVAEWMYNILRQPVVTEKSTRGSEHGQVTFKVPVEARKPDIKAAVEALFKVKVA